MTCYKASPLPDLRSKKNARTPKALINKEFGVSSFRRGSEKTCTFRRFWVYKRVYFSWVHFLYTHKIDPPGDAMNKKIAAPPNFRADERPPASGN